MTGIELIAELRRMLPQELPLPGEGETALRHSRLMELGRLDLSLARLAEAHWDAAAILAEAGRRPAAELIYGVWASEKPGHALRLCRCSNRLVISGNKQFCSGAGLVDRALVTVGELLFDVDVRHAGEAFRFDDSGWKTQAFAETQTAKVIFTELPVREEDQVGAAGFYLERPGFWHGACGPAACWAGGAEGLVDYALGQARQDPHTLAHLGAMAASVWALKSYLEMSGREIDASPGDAQGARVRARVVRHLVEQAASEILRRLPRAYGPYPLAMDEAIGLRYQELDIYLRQCHGERDLEALGRDLYKSEPQFNP